MTKNGKIARRRPAVVFNLKALSRHLKQDVTAYVPRPVKLSSERKRAAPIAAAKNA